jgi:uncharacterized protein (DUF2267 family)
MHDDELLARIAERGGFRTPAEAERAEDAALLTLGQRLELPLAQELARHLPPRAAAALLRKAYEGPFPLEELYRRVAEREGVRLSFAVEHTGVVFETVAEALPEALRARLCRLLPERMAALFEPRRTDIPAPPMPPRPMQIEPGSGTTLADGRPGSRRPISEGGGDRAQAESVARTENPHEETKLSSARGLSSERRGRTLATAGSHRKRR